MHPRGVIELLRAHNFRHPGAGFRGRQSFSERGRVLMLTRKCVIWRWSWIYEKGNWRKVRARVFAEFMNDWIFTDGGE